MSKDRRLGRGLAALLGEPLQSENTQVSGKPAPRIHRPAEAAESASTAHGSAENESVGYEESTDFLDPSGADSNGDESTAADIVMLHVDEIVENPFQPRREFGESEIAALAESLKEHDMLQPVLVRQVAGSWQLISGERRLRAAIRAGWNQVPARVWAADDRLVAELAIVENLQRKDLNAIEKALSFQRYLHEHGSTQEELGKRLKIDRSTIANLLRLLELPGNVQSAIQTGTITAGHAKALLPLGDEREQIQFCQRVIDEGLSVRATERLVSEFTAEHDGTMSLASGKKSKKRDSRSSQVAAIEQEMRRALGTKVEIATGARGRGKISIQFKNAAEFERIYAYLMDDSASLRVAGS